VAVNGFIVAQWQLQTGFAQVLRLAFRNHHQLRWNPDEKQSKIHIYDAYPYAQQRYPQIIVRVAGGPALLRGIGDEVEGVQTTETQINGVSRSVCEVISFSGNLRPTVTLEIGARSGFERAEVADWVILFLRHFAFKKLQKEGVFIQDVTMGPQTERLLGTDPIYETSINVTCLTSFRRSIPVAEAATINAVCLTAYSR
jgi:hypothetical protein